MVIIDNSGHLTGVLVENPARKLNPLKLLPIPLYTPSSDGRPLGDISWNHNLLKIPITSTILIKECTKVGVLPTKEYSLPNKQKHFLKTVSSMVSQTKAKWPLALCYGHMVIKTKTIYQGGSRGLHSCSLSLKTTESRDKTEPGKLVHLNEGLCCQNGNSVWALLQCWPYCRGSLTRDDGSVARPMVVPIPHPLQRKLNKPKIKVKKKRQTCGFLTTITTGVGGIEWIVLKASPLCVCTQDN